MKHQLLAVCWLASVFSQELSFEAKTIYPWRDPETATDTTKDRKITRLKVLARCEQAVQHLVQVKSDTFAEGEGLYRLEGPGVDQEPENLLDIDEKNGTIWSKQPLKENDQSFTVNVYAVSLRGEILERSAKIEMAVEVVDCKAPHGPGTNERRRAFVTSVAMSVVPLFLMLLVWVGGVSVWTKRQQRSEEERQEEGGHGADSMSDVVTEDEGVGEEDFQSSKRPDLSALKQPLSAAGNPGPMLSLKSTDMMDRAVTLSKWPTYDYLDYEHESWLDGLHGRMS